MWYALDANNVPYPVDITDLCANQQPSPNKIVKQEHVQIVDTDYRVSTVFLELDHNWNDGPPELWETMIFTEDPDLSYYLQRYTSYADALAGHNQICDCLRTGITKSDRFGENVNCVKKNVFNNLMKTLKNLQIKDEKE